MSEQAPVLVCGSHGLIGRAITGELRERGLSVLEVNRTSGDFTIDMSKPDEVQELAQQVPDLFGVAVAAGEVPFGPLDELSEEQMLAGIQSKLLGQMWLTKALLSRVQARGSVTLVSGILGSSPLLGSSVASAANGGLEAFVKAVALEAAPKRVNAMSPNVVDVAKDRYGNMFLGYDEVSLDRVVERYLRSILGAETGKILDV